MAISQFSGSTDIIANLGDNPTTDDGLTAAQFKAKFDYIGGQLKTYINGTLIPGVATEISTHNGANDAHSTQISTAVNTAVSTHNTANDAHSTLFSAKENTLNANQKRHIFISATEPADWVDGDIWLKSSS